MTDTIKISRELRPVLSMILNALVEEAIAPLIDDHRWEQREAEILEVRDALSKVADDFEKEESKS